ncbi:MAG: 4Fe-4S dicluster domain-containing protein [Deltaproteobacteria bacterium]|nr:4Fe-4S dicluster domain-containing protein [Deltaproteobacteria bacterium]
MPARPVFGFMKPRLQYTLLQETESPEILEMPDPQQTILLVEEPRGKGEGADLEPGQEVKTGQKIGLGGNGACSFLSPVTGTVSKVSEYAGYLGRTYTALSIGVEEDQWDEEFKENLQTSGPECILDYLPLFPGVQDPVPGPDADNPLHTVIITGMDRDLAVTTNQLIVKTQTEALNRGCSILRDITGAARIILVLSPTLVELFENSETEVKAITPYYPNAFPRLIMRDIMGTTVPAGQSYENMGVAFISAEAVVSLARAVEEERIPVHKTLTVIGKDNSRVHAKVRIGTPIKNVLDDLNMEAGQGDRVVLGGPMTGRAVYSLGDTPVSRDTDALMVQDAGDIVLSENTPCVNCGECVRICPARIPVNMLIRYLENGLIEDAAHDYDLLSCIECGLCSYVCIARIPLFHYIMFGKHEFTRMKHAEE